MNSTTTIPFTIGFEAIIEEQEITLVLRQVEHGRIVILAQPSPSYLVLKTS
jgi:hypothetical protein